MTPLDLLDFWQKCIMTRKARIQNFSFLAHLLSKGLFTWTWDSELLRDNDCPGASVTSRSHDDLLSGATLRVDLNSCSFYTNCYREWILNTFTYFWCFLELFIEKFILNINDEHAQDYSCPGVTFAFCSHGEKLPRQGGLPSNPPLEVTPGQRKTYVNSYRHQTMHRGKVDPEVSELPRGKELSRDHVNRP